MISNHNDTNESSDLTVLVVPRLATGLWPVPLQCPGWGLLTNLGGKAILMLLYFISFFPRTILLTTLKIPKLQPAQLDFYAYFTQNKN